MPFVQRGILNLEKGDTHSVVCGLFLPHRRRVRRATSVPSKPRKPRHPYTRSDVRGRLIEARLAMGLTQDELANSTGFDPKSIKNWEKRDARPPKPENIAVLALALKVPLRWLAEGEGDEPKFAKSAERAGERAPLPARGIASTRDYAALMRRIHSSARTAFVADSEDPVAAAHALLDAIDATRDRQAALVGQIAAMAERWRRRE